MSETVLKRARSGGVTQLVSIELPDISQLYLLVAGIANEDVLRYNPDYVERFLKVRTTKKNVALKVGNAHRLLLLEKNRSHLFSDVRIYSGYLPNLNELRR